MGNRYYAVDVQVFALAALAAFIIFSLPLFAYATPRNPHDMLVVRLCAVQEKLGSRLPRPIIDPAICNPAPEPTVDITALPLSINAGQTSVLSWDSSHASFCTASNGWTGSKALDGTENVTPSVTTTYAISCTGAGGTAQDSVTVTVVQPTTGTLTLQKTVTNNNGGTADADDFQAKIDGVNVPWGVAQVLTPGAHTASEVTLTGYSAGSWGGDCAADGSITLAAGENKTCSITNDDQAGTLVVKKMVVRDNGGTAATSTFSFQVNGGVATAFEEDGENSISVNAGTYTVTEVAVAGYTASYSNCENVVVSNGETETCTITNNDNAPTTGHLIVNKVTQPGGDTTEFTIHASGGTITGGGDAIVTDTNSKDYEVTPGMYSVVEDAVSGWVIISNTCTNIEVSAGETENCTITNGKLPTLTVVKVVVNDNSGTKQVADFPLFIDGNGVTSWATTTVATGTRVVSETGDAGYTAAFSGDCDSNGNVTLVYGDVKQCTITNNDNVPAVNHLLVSEVYYDVDGAHGSDTTHEWVELYNPTNLPVDLSTWALADGNTFDMFPNGTTIASGGFLVVTAASTTPGFWGNIPMVSFESAIGNGLSNDGEVLSLLDITGATTTVDSMSFGDDTSVFTLPGVAEGHSLYRSNLSVDTNAAGDWADDATPAPGVAN